MAASTARPTGRQRATTAGRWSAFMRGLPLGGLGAWLGSRRHPSGGPGLGGGSWMPLRVVSPGSAGRHAAQVAAASCGDRHLTRQRPRCRVQRPPGRVSSSRRRGRSAPVRSAGWRRPTRSPAPAPLGLAHRVHPRRREFVAFRPARQHAAFSCVAPTGVQRQGRSVLRSRRSRWPGISPAPRPPCSHHQRRAGAATLMQAVCRPWGAAAPGPVAGASE